VIYLVISVLTVGDECNRAQSAYFVMGDIICFAQESFPEVFRINSTRCPLN